MDRITETGFAIGRRFEGQVAVVTGAASGLGERIAKRLAREGASVDLLDRDTDALEQTGSSFQNLKLKASGHAVDVSAEIAIQSALEAVREEVGSPKIIVNCAVIVGPSNSPILDYPTDDYDRVYSVNLRGSFLMIKHTLPCFWLNR